MSTPDRMTLLTELAQARHENELLRLRYGNRLIRRRQSAAESAERRARREDRQFTEALKDAWAATRTDPNAATHQHILITALKEHS